MGSKRTSKKRKFASGSSESKRYRRARHTHARHAHTHAPKPEQEHDVTTETLWAARSILQDNGTHFLIEWEDIDPITGLRYEPTWEPYDFVTSALKAEWEVALASWSVGERRYNHSQNSPCKNAGDREPSQDQVPVLAIVAHSPADGRLQSPSVLISSPQVSQQSQSDLGLTSIRLLRSVCEPETCDPRSAGSILEQSVENSTSHAIIAMDAALDLHHQTSAVVDAPGDINDEELSFTHVSAPSLSQSSHTSPSASTKRSTSVEHTDQLPGPKTPEMVRDGTELDLLEQTPGVSMETQTPGVDESKFNSPTPLRSTESYQTVEQYNAYDGPEVRCASLPGPDAEAPYGMAVPSAEITRTENVEEQGQSPKSSDQSPKGLLIRHLPHTKLVIQAPEQTVSLSQGHGKPAKQTNIDRTHSLLDLVNSTQIEHSRTWLEQRQTKEDQSVCDGKGRPTNYIHPISFNIPNRDRPSDNRRESARSILNDASVSTNESVNCGIPPQPTNQLPSQDLEFSQRHAFSSEDDHNYDNLGTAWLNVSSLQHPNPFSTELVHSSITGTFGTTNHARRVGMRRFSNRTKTGCITCRRRKKKCDEEKPECGNCTRGAFVCEGYPNKVQVHKNRAAKSQLVLLSPKEHTVTDLDQSDSGRLVGVHTSSSNTHNTCLDSHAPGGHGWNTGRHSTATRMHPMPMSYPQLHLTLSPEGYPPTVEAYHKATRLSQPHQRPPVAPPVATSSRPLPIAPPAAISSRPPPIAPPVAISSRAPPVAPPVAASSSPPPVALLVAASSRPPLSHYAPDFSTCKTEKQKMLAGEPFMPYNVELVSERAQCMAAICRFNNTSYTGFEQCLRQIVEASRIQPCHAGRLVGGHIGHDVHVAGPFYSDYGYNISIDDGAVIGPNCQLLDSGRISIGKNTTICARVTIRTLELPTDTMALRGSRGTESAKNVYIGENVYVGDGSIIGAGVRVGNNAIIRPGAIVLRNILPNCIASGNPANCTCANSR